jgi:hypothetical protein
MRSRSVPTILLLATSGPILVFAVLGLRAELSSVSIAASYVFAEILAGVTLAMIGAFYSRKPLSAVGAGLLFGVSFPLLVDGFFVFALLPAASSLILLSVSGSQRRVRKAELAI